MTTWQLLLTDWHAHPSVLIGCIAMALVYAAITRLRPRRAALCFGAGVLILALALLSPLHTLGERYLFSAHMLQHLLLLQAVPPLLLLGLPENFGESFRHEDAKIRQLAKGSRQAVARGWGTLWASPETSTHRRTSGGKAAASPPEEDDVRGFAPHTPRVQITFNNNSSFVLWCLAGYSRTVEVARAFAAAAEHVLGRPTIAWLLGIGTMWLWHVPGLYNATLAQQDVHIFEHVTFLATAVIFWWPLLGPASRRLAPLGATVYLFAAMAASSVLGIILTFAPPGLYPAYLQPIDDLGILPLLREGLGLTPAADQQLGGLLMWVPGNLAYLGALIAMLARWYRMPDGEPLVEALG